MAKKKKKKKSKEEAPKLSKREVKAYYKEHGWKETITHFGIAPKDLSPIVKGKKSAAAPKKKKKSKKAAKAQAPKKKKAAGKKGKSAEAPYGYKKDGTPRKPPGRKAGKKASKKAAPKKRGRPPAAAKTKKHSRPPGRPTADEEVLDWLLAYRAKNQKAGHMLPLDSVIIDLTAKIRK